MSMFKKRFEVRGKFHTVIVDDEDAWIFIKYNITITNKKNSLNALNRQDYFEVRVQKKGTQQTTTLAKLLMPSKPGHVIDHKNNNGLDNRRKNFRYATTAQNNRNRSKSETFKGKKPTSKYIGVSWKKGRDVWQAQVWLNNKVAWIKQFKDEVEAAKARDKKAIELHGEFAKLNFPRKKKLIKRT